jgi:hypothetical protein
MEYLNSTSMKAVVELLMLLHSIKSEGIAVEVMWRYEKDDEDMLDLGEDLKMGSNSEIVFIPV